MQLPPEDIIVRSIELWCDRNARTAMAANHDDHLSAVPSLIVYFDDSTVNATFVKVIPSAWSVNQR